MNINLKELERKFHADGYHLGMRVVQSDNEEGALPAAVSAMHRMVDEIVAYFSAYAESQKRSPDCRKGCSWCCYQPVFALSYELDSLHGYLKGHFSDEEMDLVYKRAALKRSKLSRLKGDELLNSKYACPLLENDACMAYPARPVACRIYLSSDVNSCISFYKEPEKKDAVPALLDFPMRMGRMINEGFRAALKAGGTMSEEYRIEEFNSIGGQQNL